MSIGSTVWINCPVSDAHGHIGLITGYAAGPRGMWTVAVNGQSYRLHISEMELAK